MTAPTIAQTQAALASLPDGFDAIGARLLRAPGMSVDALLTVADALDEGATARAETLGAWDAEVRAMQALAKILRDAATVERFPQPPKTPLSAEEADASILARRAYVAGLSTAGGS